MSVFNPRAALLVTVGLGICPGQLLAQPVEATQPVDSIHPIEPQSLATSQASSLAQLVRYGLTYNPRVLSSVAEVKQAEKNVEINEGRYWPSVSLSAGPADGVKINDKFVYDATLTYTLYDWGALDSELDSMNAEARKALHNSRQVRSEVGLDIIEAYLDIVQAQQKHELIKEYQKRLARVERLANARAAGGYSDRAEINRVRQARFFSEQQWQQADNELQQATLRLQMLLQRPVNVNQLPELPHDYLQLQQYLPSLSQQADLIKHSPQYMQALEEVNVLKGRADSIEAQQLPKLVVQAASQRREIGGDLTRDQSVAMRLQANFNQGLSSFDIGDVQRLQAQGARWDQQYTQLDMDRDINTQRGMLQNLDLQRTSLNQQVEASTRLLSAYEEQFSAGLANVQSILDSEQERFGLRVQYLTTSMELLRIPYRISSSLGILDSVLDAQSHELASTHN